MERLLERERERGKKEAEEANTRGNDLQGVNTRGISPLSNVFL
jgi:hypothetical protein